MPHSRQFPAIVVVTFAMLVGCVVITADDRIGLCRSASATSIEPCALRIRADDEIWIVSSRCIRTCDPIDLSQLECFRWSGTEFFPAERQLLPTEHFEETKKRTILYSHGNRTDLQWSASRGLQVFDSVFGDESDRPPVRFVIWSWPADPQSRRIKEYRDNSQRSVWEANVLAEFLHDLGGASPIGLMGYSFGAQSVVFAAEKACSRAICEGNDPLQFRIVCIAPAYQKPWSRVAEPLAGCEECLLEPALQMSNSQDRALRVHDFISRFAKNSYAGSTAVDELSPSVGHPIYLDIGALVGPQHSVVKYVSPPFVAEQIRETLLNIKEPGPGEALKAIAE